MKSFIILLFVACIYADQQLQRPIADDMKDIQRNHIDSIVKQYRRNNNHMMSDMFNMDPYSGYLNNAVRFDQFRRRALTSKKQKMKIPKEAGKIMDYYNGRYNGPNGYNLNHVKLMEDHGMKGYERHHVSYSQSFSGNKKMSDAFNDPFFNEY
ncbi:Uncharacterized protein QTN25_007643 [Entamoeba marina]